jgi:hypothetical protein
VNRIGSVRDREQIVAGAMMIMGPFVLLVAAALHPAHSVSAESWLEAAESGRLRFYIAHVLFLVAAVLLVPALLGLARRVRGSEPTLAAIAAPLSMIGLFGWAGLIGADLVTWQAAGSSLDQSEMLALLDRVSTNPGVLIPLSLLLIGLSTGVSLLALGLYRAHLAPAPVAALIPLGAAGFGAGIPVTAVAISGAACLLAGFGYVGLGTLRDGLARQRSPKPRPILADDTTRASEAPSTAP